MQELRSHKEVLRRVQVWHERIRAPHLRVDLGREIQEWTMLESILFKPVAGFFLLRILWRMAYISRNHGLLRYSIWLSEKSIQYDHWSFEPNSCERNISYTSLGLGRLKAGEIELAIDCLIESAMVNPCPHNTSFGLKMKLYDELKSYPEANEALVEYKKIANAFLRRGQKPTH